MGAAGPCRAEVALSVALLVTTVLLARSVRHLAAADPGFDKDHVLAMSVSLPEATYPDTADLESFFGRLQDQLGSLPGVISVGMIQTMPFSTSGASTTFEVVGQAPSGIQRPVAALRQVTPGYFAAMRLGARLLRCASGDYAALRRRSARHGELCAPGVVLIAVALLASWAPALRALRADPGLALRAE